MAALGIDAVGTGVWMPLSVLYFLEQTPLSLVELGLAMTLASVAVIPLVPLVGSVVDRFGAKRVLQAGNLLQAAAFLSYPLVHSQVPVAGAVFVATVGRTMVWGANGPLVSSITRPGQREQWFGFVQALRNVGFGIGGLVAAIALAIGSTTAYDGVVLANAASYLLSFCFLVPVTAGGRPEPSPDRPRPGERLRTWAHLGADRGYLWLVVATFCYALVAMSLNVAMPVYFVESLHLPHWVPGAVYVVNTVMVGLGQGLVVRRVTGVVRAKGLLAAMVLTASSFVLLLAAGALTLRTGLVVVFVAAVVYTLGELVAGPLLAALAGEAPPERMRGRYMSAVQLAWNGASAVAPLLYTSLLALGGAALWGGGIAVCLLWGLVLVPLVRTLPLARRPVGEQRSGSHDATFDRRVATRRIPPTEEVARLEPDGAHVR